jgi:hypothetical protein
LSQQFLSMMFRNSSVSDKLIVLPIMVTSFN